MEKQQSDPDKLLSLAKEEEVKRNRGKLKIFFGAAPGVGKTYAMLEEALEKRAEGLDVVIGVVESHGREETQNLLNKLDQIPRQTVQYRDKTLEEFDLDAAIARAPALLLVDEMAHTNVPGCRHEKRWQDIKELIDRGIDVYTSLNVQHVESLNDVVAQITGVRVRETVPDSMLELAENMELVDIAPDDLLQRLKEGKVYFPTQANLAVEKFFRKSNLVALRELALRATAEQVNLELLSQRRGQSSGSPVWPTTERLLVCVGPGASSAKLVRAARRLATRLQAQWLAIYVEPLELNSSEAKRQGAMLNLRLAEQLGAETMLLGGKDIVKEIIAFAKARNVSKIVLGKQVRPRWKEWFFRSLVDELMRHSDELDIYIIRGDDQDAPRQEQKFDTNTRTPFTAYLIAGLYVLIATGLNFLLFGKIAASNLIMVYLLTIIIVALRGQQGPSIFASFFSVLLYDFCFIPSRYSLPIHDVEYFVTLVVMLIVSQTISYLTIITKRQAQLARLRERRTIKILGLSRQLANHRGVEALLSIAVSYLGEIFDSEVVALLPNAHQQLQVQPEQNLGLVFSDKEKSVAQWSYDLKQMAGLGTQTLPFSEALYVPLLGTQLIVGVLRIKPKQPKQFVLPENLHLLEACVRQVSLAIEVDRLQQDARAE